MIFIDPTDVRADYPAVEYIGARPMRDYDTGEDIVSVHHGDQFAVLMPSKIGREPMHHEFQAFTIVGYAVEHAECPFKALEKAKERGHKLYSAFGLSVSITAHNREKKRFAVLDLGQRVKIEGKVFTVAEDHNSNIKFVEVG